MLAAVLGAFVREQFEARSLPATATEIVAVMSRLNDAVFILMQTTVDTFVRRYTEMIDEQTMRLEGFNRMVSHELRQPLASIQYAISLLGTPAGTDATQRDRFLEVAGRNVRRLSQMLGMLGALVHRESDNALVQEIDLAKTVGEVLRQLRDSSQAKDVALEADVSSMAVTVDASRLELVLVNLVSNGIKNRDTARSDPFVAVSASRAGDDIEITVRDNGLGIPEDDQPHVFRRFYRAHALLDGALGNEGSGLGLAIVAECVKELGGRITLASTPGEGTTFTVVLPAAPTAS